MNDLQKLNYQSLIIQSIDLLNKAKEFKTPFENLDKAILKINKAHKMAIDLGVNRSE